MKTVYLGIILFKLVVGNVEDLAGPCVLNLEHHIIRLCSFLNDYLVFNAGVTVFPN
jgi:hypothetical protein